MMKRIRHITILIAAIAVFFTGTGVTVLNYCCSGCVSELLSFNSPSCACSSLVKQIAEADTSCCLHGESEDHMMKSSDCETGIQSGETHCSSSRLSIDLDQSVFKPHLTIPFIWLSEASVYTTSLLADFFEQTDISLRISDPPIIVSPRSYLSFIRILII